MRSFSLAQPSRRASALIARPSDAACRRQRQTHTTISASSDAFFLPSDYSSDPAVSLLSRKSQLPSEIHTCTAGSGRLASLRVEIETTQSLASSLERESCKLQERTERGGNRVTMMLSDLSSDQEATGSSSHGGDMASYSLSPFFLEPAGTTAPPPPQPEQPRVGAKRKRSQPGNPGN
jgi:hypothetical protein